MNEIWKPIKGYKHYFVSSHGRIKSTKFWNGTNERFLKPSKSQKGYLYVTLSENGKTKTYLIHRIVATEFIPNPNEYTQINHINEIKTDNRIENLEWCSPFYNVNYGLRTTKQIEKCSKQVRCVEKNKIYPSASSAAKENGLNQGNISNCCIGRNKTAGGYHWEYV